jgi:hypothetical protein
VNGNLAARRRSGRISFPFSGEGFSDAISVSYINQEDSITFACTCDPNTHYSIV